MKGNANLLCYWLANTLSITSVCYFTVARSYLITNCINKVPRRTTPNFRPVCTTGKLEVVQNQKSWQLEAYILKHAQIFHCARDWTTKMMLTGLQHLTSALIVSLATGSFWKTPLIRKNIIIYFSALLRVSGAGQLKSIPYLDSTGSKNPEVIPLESKKFPLSHKYSQNIIHRCCTPS